MMTNTLNDVHSDGLLTEDLISWIQERDACTRSQAEEVARFWVERHDATLQRLAAMSHSKGN